MAFLGELRKFQEPVCLAMVNKKKFLNIASCGLGKTVMAIAAAEKLFELNLADKNIIISLATLKEQWCNKLDEFSSRHYTLIDGTPKQVAAQWEEARRKRNKYVVLNYETVVAKTPKPKKEDIKSLLKVSLEDRMAQVEEAARNTHRKISPLWDLLEQVGYERSIITADESCFPAGTLVDTPTGFRPIETIKAGDKILNCIGVSTVRGTRITKQTTYVKIRYNNVTTVVSLFHPFLTKQGWKPAYSLTTADMLVRREYADNLCRVRSKEDVASLYGKEAAFLWEVLLRDMENAATLSTGEGVYESSECHNQQEDKSVHGDILHEGAVSSWKGNEQNALARSAGESVQGACWPALPYAQGWKWAGNDSPTKNATENTGEDVGCRVCCVNEGANEETQNPVSLQDRLGVPHVETRCGDRWGQPQSIQSAGSRQEEADGAGYFRVENIEVCQFPDSYEADFESGREEDRIGDSFYDLEVAGHPSYSVNGVLVHNSKIKSRKSKTAKRIKTLSARWVWCLSATPLENSPDDLFSIMEFLNPNILGSYYTYKSNFCITDYFGSVVGYKNLPKLHSLLKPYFMRITTEEVKDQLPEMLTKDYLVDLDDATSLYNFVKADLLSDLEGLPDSREIKEDLEDSGMCSIMQKYSVLRQICQSPQILKDSENEYAQYLIKQGMVKDQMGGKLNEVVERVKAIIRENTTNKIVLFNFYKGFLELVAGELFANKIGFVKYTGDESKEKRRDAEYKFSNDTRCRVMLCTDAGGVGLDLPVGNYIYNTDLPFNPAKLRQRNRIQRISSRHKVNTMLTVTCRGSVESRIYSQLLRKEKIKETVIDGKHLNDSESANFVMNKKNLYQFLTGETV